MAHAIMRGANGRRHDVDFEGVEITVEIFFGDDTVEIAVEEPKDLTPSNKRRLALLNVPRDCSTRLSAEAARRSKSRGPRSPWSA